MRKATDKPASLIATVSITTCDDTLDSQPEFEKLMAQLAAGSEEAAWKVATQYTPHILRAVRASLPNALRPKLDSVDFAQIVWASMLQRRSYLAGAPTPQHLIALLATVARRKVTDAIRRNTYQVRDIRREQSLDAADETASRRKQGNAAPAVYDPLPSPSQLVGLREKWTALVDNLDSRDRKILHLRFLGKTYPEIAEQLEVSEWVVRRVVERIIQQLRS
jgi:RNA polymerase sigma factor (sigma-70 family)